MKNKNQKLFINCKASWRL